MKRSGHSLVLAMSMSFALAACDPPGTVTITRKQVLLELVIVDTPKLTALDIAAEFRDPHTSGRAFNRVEELIRNKEWNSSSSARLCSDPS
jgi:hypothetical protein